MKNNILKTAFVLGLSALSLVSCNRNDDDVDDLPQEELSNIILLVKDNETHVTNTYDYSVNSTTYPTITLLEGHSYSVQTVFKNGDENVTQEIIDAKDEHFLTYNFTSNNVTLTRTDDESSTNSDGVKIGLKTNWVVNSASAAGAKIIVTLIHGPASASEEQNGTVWGSVTGGETDAMATYHVGN